MPVAFRIARPRSICRVSLQLKNVAAVMVTRKLLVFAQVGQ
jgi:flagellar basal body P-ring protein FlgI